MENSEWLIGVAPEEVTGVGMRVLTRGSRTSRYRLRVVPHGSLHTEDLHAAQALRFMVFNLELNEGLEQSYATLRDEDPFDSVCDHLLVEDVDSGEVVGTYRLQTGLMAACNRGYYSAQEFDFSPFESVRPEVVELGRACVHRDHRNLIVLSMLWRGIIAYAQHNGCRYLVGCSSLTSQDPREGASAYLNLGPDYLVEARFRTHAWSQYACPLDQLAEVTPRLTPLLRAYLSFGARICGAPAIDRDFKTIDFLTWMDLHTLSESARRLTGSPTC
jgi:putative hemolysin